MIHNGGGNRKKLLAAAFIFLTAAASLCAGGGGEKNAASPSGVSTNNSAAPADTSGVADTNPAATYTAGSDNGGVDTFGGGNSGWTRKKSRNITFEISDLILFSVFLLCGLLVFVLARGIGGIIAESAAIRLDAAALLIGDLMPSEKKKRIVRIKKRMSGLRVKLAFFTTVLVFLVEFMASAPLYFMMSRNQRQRLIEGLEERSTVLLEALAASARANLSNGDIADMSLLPAQMVSIPEALYVTITGYNPDTLLFGDQVWATNDPNILQKIDTPALIPGQSRLADVLSPRVQVLGAALNTAAKERASGMPMRITNLNRELQELREQAKLDNSPDIALRIEELGINITILESSIANTFFRIESGIYSEPDYSPEDFVVSPNGRYILYKPIMSRLGSEDNFFWGVVRLEISVNSIMARIALEQRNLMKVNLLLALAAQTVGIIGALILSAIIIRPIRQLVKHVEIIRDTEDKAKLAGVEIALKSHDELAILGNTINDMTHGLVNAALAASDLSIGKEIQKKFLPLEMDRSGDKLSTGFEETKYFHLFGYYEGAKGVSGDYFDFQDLDGRYYAIIKCDVAGKGIPASFIMIQVATMFLNFFRRWKPTEKGMHIEDLVYQINEFIEALAFKDRFAAFTLCLYDSHTGTTRFCNAGDNIIHLYDASEGRFKSLPLPETPAAGVLPNIMVESKGGYRVQTIILDHGDILLLFTDGIEESKRRFRNALFEEIRCAGGSRGPAHENHVQGQGDEEFGYERVEAIVNAVMNKEIYTLHKWHNPEGENNDLRFDFRSSNGSVEEVIMALISVEKMFRCYYNPNASEESRVHVDKVVDSFLKRFFLQYRNYCSFTRESRANNAYMYYTHVMEDEQYDDLTILGIQRK